MASELTTRSKRPDPNVACSIASRTYVRRGWLRSARDSRDSLAHLVLARRRIHAQQVERGQQHPRGAEAALQPVMLPERLLERVQPSVAHQSLHGRDVGAVRLHGEHQAGARGLAVDEHGAGAADAVLATDVGAGEAEVLAQEVHEQLARLAAALAGRAVDGETNVSHARSPARASARAP